MDLFLEKKSNYLASCGRINPTVPITCRNQSILYEFRWFLGQNGWDGWIYPTDYDYLTNTKEQYSVFFKIKKLRSTVNVFYKKQQNSERPTLNAPHF
jgi:hypothetical protein